MELEDLRRGVDWALVRTGRAPDLAELAEQLGASRPEAERGLAELARDRYLALDADGRIVMGQPFSGVPLGFSVMGRQTLWWGGCAWDSFALPHLLPDEDEVLVATRCPACGRTPARGVGR